MTFGPILPLLLLAIPVLVAVVVVLAGIIGMLFGSRAPAPLPRAIANSVPPARKPVVVAYHDDEVTTVFDRAFAR
jgi:hypothetical protein